MANPLTPGLDKARASVAQLRRAFDGRPRRERLLLIGAGMAVVWMLGDSLWLAPAFKDWSGAQIRRDAALGAVQRLGVEARQRSAETRSTEQQLREEVVQLRKRVGEGEAALRAFGGPLVSAPEMVPMLARLLDKTGGLRLRSLQSLGRVEVGASTAATAPQAASAPASPSATNTTAKPPSAVPGSAPPAALYRHGVELTVEGSYAAVVAYLLAVEALPQHILWGGLQLKVDHYPVVGVTLRLYTLSQDRNWLEI